MTLTVDRFPHANAALFRYRNTFHGIVTSMEQGGDAALSALGLPANTSEYLVLVGPDRSKVLEGKFESFASSQEYSVLRMRLAGLGLEPSPGGGFDPLESDTVNPSADLAYDNDGSSYWYTYADEETNASQVVQDVVEGADGIFLSHSCDLCRACQASA